MARSVFVVAILAATVAAPLTAQAAGYERIGHAAASGQDAAARASGSAPAPKGLYVRVRAAPRQPVAVRWSVSCTAGYGGGTKSGRFTTSSPKLRPLRMPTSRPDECTVSARGQLHGRGRLNVTLYMR